MLPAPEASAFAYERWNMFDVIIIVYRVFAILYVL
jgi:hypothetical protein